VELTLSEDQSHWSSVFSLFHMLADLSCSKWHIASGTSANGLWFSAAMATAVSAACLDIQKAVSHVREPLAE
jgi:hypothetical protein